MFVIGKYNSIYPFSPKRMQRESGFQKADGEPGVYRERQKNDWVLLLINKEPNSNTTDLDSSEGRGIFYVAHNNTAPSFKKQKIILNEMVEFVEIFNLFSQVFSVFLWRNDRHYSRIDSLENDCICIIPLIRWKVFCLKSLDQLHYNYVIHYGTRSDKESHWHRVHPRPDVSWR